MHVMSALYNYKISLCTETMFFTSLTCFSTIAGFGMTLALTKKSDPDAFSKVGIELHHYLNIIFNCIRVIGAIYIIMFIND